MEVFSEYNYLEIERLAINAINAPTKKAASSFIKELDFLQQNCGYDGSINVILGQLVAYVKSAAGQVKNKEFYVRIVEDELCKLHRKVKEAEE